MLTAETAGQRSRPAHPTAVTSDHATAHAAHLPTAPPHRSETDQRGPAAPETLGNDNEYTWGDIQYHARLCHEAGYLILANTFDRRRGI